MYVQLKEPSSHWSLGRSSKLPPRFPLWMTSPVNTPPSPNAPSNCVSPPLSRNSTLPSRLWRFPLITSGNRHRRRQSAPRGANRRGVVAPTLGGGANRRWRQSAVAVAPIGGGGGANRRLAVAPIGVWRWRQSAVGGGAGNQATAWQPRA